MSNNPYQTPDAELNTSEAFGEFKLGQPKSVSAGRGWGWIADGFGHFKKSPGAWIGAFLVFIVIVIVLNFIPFVGQLVFMLTSYVWVAGFIIGCRDQDQGKTFQFNHLFAGFSKGTGKLILLSVIAGLISVGVMFATIGSLYFNMLSGDPAASQEIANDLAGFWLAILFSMLLMIPLMMAVWFAPALIALNNVSILEALKLSFIGCLKNILPFLVFGVIALVLYILAILPLGLGLLVFIPTMFASMYFSYKDIFLEK